MFGAIRPGSSMSVMVGMMERKSDSTHKLTQGNGLYIITYFWVYEINVFVVYFGYYTVFMGIWVHLGLLFYRG